MQLFPVTDVFYWAVSSQFSPEAKYSSTCMNLNHSLNMIWFINRSVHLNIVNFTQQDFIRADRCSGLKRLNTQEPRFKKKKKSDFIMHNGKTAGYKSYLPISVFGSTWKYPHFLFNITCRALNITGKCCAITLCRPILTKTNHNPAQSECLILDLWVICFKCQQAHKQWKNLSSRAIICQMEQEKWLSGPWL